ncbi:MULTISPECIES: hypothetical protein [unclassified Pseudoclavibacter]|uniref:hypothetical protein n=1 Tax=unclassified Pseudoclavibacter TaxID=2615177 RepID=UPI000CE8A0F0|nr:MULTISPECIES: hypothetical protein [unclassified Pseudoclavibacter]MBF4551108.1 hypothetical protein [Pseudoclavibacter sp. VKM Ac-2888]PPG01442.1 hypothetical protein C5E06_15800 [Pseudoclavibacter sp. RFBI5]
MPETTSFVPIAPSTIGQTLPFVDAAREQIIHALQLIALDNARALYAFGSGTTDICTGLRLLAVSDAWSSPAQRCLAIEAELLADAIGLVATAAGLAEAEYRRAHGALSLELEALGAR